MSGPRSTYTPNPPRTQLPERLGLRLQQPSAGASDESAPAAAAAKAAAKAATSPLLRQLLAEALSPAASGAAEAALAVLDEGAARSNDFDGLFRCRSRFGEARAAGAGALSFACVDQS